MTRSATYTIRPSIGWSLFGRFLIWASRNAR